MKNLMTVAAFAAATCVATLGFISNSYAQSIDPKREWAVKVVALQQGPELDRLVEQLAASTTQELLQNWAPKVDALPQARQGQVKEALNTELQKYSDDAVRSIGSKVSAVSSEALVPAYMERFSLEELKQIASFFESPVIKKYQSAAPELGSVFVQKLVESTRSDITARVGQFNDAAGKIVGAVPAPRTGATPATKAKPAAPAAKQ